MVLYGAEHLTERAQAYDLLERAARLHWGWDRLPEMARAVSYTHLTLPTT